MAFTDKKSNRSILALHGPFLRGEILCALPAALDLRPADTVPCVEAALFLSLAGRKGLIH
jgi:hypothetical protein